MKKISIIIRTKNEERWINHCLKSIFRQDYPSFEVILVDNISTDNTLSIAKRYPIAKYINIDEFKPGRAINKGIAVSNGELICCISAHCIPKKENWLSTLANNLIDDKNIGGVYGRQIPMSFTEDIDKRDLLIVFGRDKRVQKKDYFFHNANSMIRREIWEKFNFDEEVTNIEDRVWGKKIIEEGLKIVYEPDAEVFHHHGLHQGNNPKRAKGVVSVIEKIETESINDLPESMLPENSEIIALIPVSKILKENSIQKQLFEKAVKCLEQSKFIKSIFVLSDQKSICTEDNFWLDRSKIKDVENLNLDQILQHAQRLLEKKNIYPDSIIYFNFDYENRTTEIIDNLIKKFLYGGYETAFCGYVDYSHYWFKNLEGEFNQTDDSFSKREKRDPVFRALYGLGCISNTHNIKRGKMVSGKIGILPIKEEKYTKRFFST